MDDGNKFTYKIWLHLEEWDNEKGVGTDIDLPNVLFESDDKIQTSQFYDLLVEACSQLNKFMNGERD